MCNYIYNDNNGIDPNAFHLPRTKVVLKLRNLITQYRTIVISSPPGSGKTSLYDLLSREGGNWIYIGFLQADFAQFCEDLKFERITDKKGDPVTLASKCIFFLDDCQQTYHKPDAWAELVKDVMTRKTGPKFVISATHLLESEHPSPTALRSFERLQWETYNFRATRRFSCSEHPPLLASRKIDDLLCSRKSLFGSVTGNRPAAGIAIAAILFF
ncbi:hypothetical protein DFS34DRAFT_481484 [Phlyctochytrium arcticum]|nr:hypothetical protein DFS34DRAFT_481484 [Phlyctochytrium arcticum]